MSISYSMRKGQVEVPKELKFFAPEPSCESSEAIIFGDKNIEQRVAVHCKDFSETCRCIGQLLMEFPDGTYGGTASLVSCVVGTSRKWILLSCAHNFCQIKLDIEGYLATFPKKVTFRRGLDGEDFLSTHEVEKFFLPELYLRNKDKGAETLMSMGVDYAFCTLRGDTSKLDDEKLPNLLPLDVPDADDIDASENISVTGYPGEKNGVMYTMVGSPHKIKQKESGAVISYKNINTSKGQSGSPVIQKGLIKAIHVCGSWVNFGTIITKSVKEWIRYELSVNVAATWLQNKHDDEKINGIALNLLAKMAMEADQTERKNILEQTLESQNEANRQYLSMIALDRYPNCCDRPKDTSICLPVV